MDHVLVTLGVISFFACLNYRQLVVDNLLDDIVVDMIHLRDNHSLSQLFLSLLPKSWQMQVNCYTRAFVHPPPVLLHVQGICPPPVLLHVVG